MVLFLHWYRTAGCVIGAKKAHTKVPTSPDLLKHTCPSRRTVGRAPDFLHTSVPPTKDLSPPPTPMPPAAEWSLAELHGMGRCPALPIDDSECVWAEIFSAERPWGPARTHAEGVMWPPPGRTWTRTGGTSGARMTSAEDKKSLTTVRSHAIPIILFQCFQLRLGRNPSAERPWGLARTHAEGVMWPPPERTWPRTGGTSGARSASAENKKSLKTVGSHAILNMSFQCFRLRLGGDSLG